MKIISIVGYSPSITSGMLYSTDMGGASGLRKVDVSKKESEKSEEEGGAFTDPAAQDLLQKAKTNTTK